MRFFNLDLHIGVIADIKSLLTSLGHEVVDWTISGHAWALGRTPDRVDVCNQETWRSIDKQMADAFYERYRDELSGYDAFIVTHTPVFSTLYEKWGKPVICVASTRYENPFAGDRARWEYLNEFLIRQIDDGLVIPVANNQYDADYAEAFTGRAWRVIPSVCDYTGTRYTGSRRESLYYSKFSDFPSMDGVMTREQLFTKSIASRIGGRFGLKVGKQGYDWKDLAEFRSIIHMPYNASVMSIFEMYSAATPMFFPSLKLARELYDDAYDRGFLSELSFNKVFGLPPGSAIPAPSPDPNAFDDLASMSPWIAKADFYDPGNLKHLLYFDSFEELPERLANTDFHAVSEAMQQHAALRRRRALDAWSTVVGALT